MEPMGESKRQFSRVSLAAAFTAVLIGATNAFAQGTSFTYQGRLNDGGTPANGSYDLQFALWDSLNGGAQIGSPQSVPGASISNGAFTVTLDFGPNAFPGASRFLEISVRPNGGSFTTLSPRVQVTSTPYAVHSLNSTSADSLSSSCAGCVTVAKGGTGATSFTANAPLIGNGTAAVSAGSRSGNTTTFATTNGTLTSSHCVQIDSNGNLVDSGAGCGGGGGGGLPDPGNNGLLVRTASNTTGARTLLAGTPLTITNADGTTGNPTVSLTGVVATANGGTGLGSSGASGNFLKSDGSVWTSAALSAADLPSSSGNYIQNTTSTQAGSNFNISGNGIVGGMVGIGTTAPTQTLHVAGNGLFTGNLMVNGTLNATLPSGSGNYIQNTTSPQSNSNFNISGAGTIGGNGYIGSGITVDTANLNSGNVNPGLNMGNGGEGIASKRTSGGNQYGIDFYTNNAARLSITNGGNVGIGTTGPLGQLQVVTNNDTTPSTIMAWDSRHFVVGNTGSSGGIGMSYDQTNNVGYIEALSPDKAWRNLVLQSGGGKVGIGTAPDPTDTSRLQVDGGGTGSGVFGRGFYAGVSGSSTNYGVLGNSDSGFGVVGASSSSGIGVLGQSSSGTGVSAKSSTGVGVVATSITGNLVEGYSNIIRKFHIDNGGTYTAGSDFAEALPARGGKNSYEPGDVLVVSAKAPGEVEKTSRPYDQRLAGVYSTRPGVLGADKNGISRVDADELPVAIVGIVPTKVSTENGPIRVGDLLTTSSTPGYGMRASPVRFGKARVYRTGAILGKALEPLSKGKGVIKVLVTLR
jgi:hypothetical protein